MFIKDQLCRDCGRELFSVHTDGREPFCTVCASARVQKLAADLCAKQDAEYGPELAGKMRMSGELPMIGSIPMRLPDTADGRRCL